MKTTIWTGRVGPDGVLRVALPLGVDAADGEVKLTVEPTTPTVTTTDEWAAWVRSMAGSIPDPTFRRHEQGEYEQREEFP